MGKRTSSGSKATGKLSVVLYSLMKKPIQTCYIFKHLNGSSAAYLWSSCDILSITLALHAPAVSFSRETWESRE